ncbi:hypothetical protein GBF35_25620 [Nonomuraea phyllanthi]|uniref:hypothetical protein n=1 Tax=Nonomuraea phyllanthi TaxID=2219224 RepID=UPI001293836B|nr:hypothetical protein [Nonomuraea phyllanthi]QFY09579.1 hypothetical protein GBF35_25620 [Nonomuraea phyllanthi]
MGKVFDHKDSSGKVTIAVFQEVSSQEQAHHFDLQADVDPDMVVVGGGATATDKPNGALLTASYPNENRTGWRASSKDHNVPNPHRLTVYAIGMKINGLTRDDLMGNLRFVRETSDVAAHPVEDVSAPQGFKLIGGGFRVNWAPGPGNLATGSFPVGGSWKARSKDHFAASPCTIDVFGIALRNSIPGVGGWERIVEDGTSSEAAHPSAHFSLDEAFALTGVGAEVFFSEPGSLLWKLEPRNGNVQGVTTASKDHQRSSPAKVKAYAIGIRFL